MVISLVQRTAGELLSVRADLAQVRKARLDLQTRGRMQRADKSTQTKQVSSEAWRLSLLLSQ
jgi:hypothetical protein